MESVVLQRLQDDVTQVAVAAAMGVSETTISHLKNKHLRPLCVLLHHAGLKIVPTEMQCYSAEKIGALLTLAKAHMAEIESVQQLSWEWGLVRENQPFRRAHAMGALIAAVMSLASLGERREALAKIPAYRSHGKGRGTPARVWTRRSGRYMPHQGKREIERRLRQIDRAAAKALAGGAKPFSIPS